MSLRVQRSGMKQSQRLCDCFARNDNYLSEHDISVQPHIELVLADEIGIIKVVTPLSLKYAF